jgi:glycosyltransferase involved in cell wall biosynthesis
VTVHREIKRTQYLEILKKCAVVALPLLDTQRSTGQVVLLEAMAYGKPAVTTDSPGTRDHIRDSETGFLVPVGDAEALAKQIIILLDSPEVRKQIGENAVEEVRHKYLVDTHAKAKLDAIEDLWKSTHQDSQGTAIC